MVKKNNFFVLILLGVVIIGAFVFQEKKVDTGNHNESLVITSDFDFNNENIQAVAKQLKQQSSSDLDLIQKTITYTRSHVDYDGGLSSLYCFTEKASDVLSSKKGDCVSMSKLNTALLRANGIPARTVGGCISFTKTCNILFAVTPGEEIPQPSAIRDGKKRGYEHEWVEAFDGNKWISIESTTGQIFDSSCGRYIKFGYDSNNFDRCVITDSNFLQKCDVA